MNTYEEIEAIKKLIYKQKSVNSTEAFFNIRKQPKNACPIADNFIVKIKKYENGCYLLAEKLKEVPTMRLSDEIYRFYVTQIDNALEILTNNLIILEQIECEIELWRTRCLEARVMFSDYKKDFWNALASGNQKELNMSSISQLSAIDNNTSFFINSIELEKYSSEDEFYMNYISFIDTISQDIFLNEQQTLIDLFPLKEIYIEIYEWGNQIIHSINNFFNDEGLSVESTNIFKKRKISQDELDFFISKIIIDDNKDLIISILKNRLIN